MGRRRTHGGGSHWSYAKRQAKMKMCPARSKMNDINVRTGNDVLNVRAGGTGLSAGETSSRYVEDTMTYGLHVRAFHFLLSRKA